MKNLIGQSLGRYHILEQLGEGGMATVYKAYDTRLERDVAIKVIRRGTFPPDHLERILKRFEHEAKALAKLSHLHIIKVIDYGEHEGSPYLVMEYMPGGTLKQRLGRPFPWQEAVRILLPIAEALEYAHEQNIIHRDIKPSNILLTEKGQPMLSDFGIAKILQVEDTIDLTGPGAVVGTVEYMSPEQALGKSVDGRSDMYSLGIVLYEIMTGRKPFMVDKTTTPEEVKFKHINEPLPFPRSIVKDLPIVAENVLIKTLAKNREQRFENMRMFISVLKELVKGNATFKINIQTEQNRATKVRKFIFYFLTASLIAGQLYFYLTNVIPITFVNVFFTIIGNIAQFITLYSVIVGVPKQETTANVGDDTAKKATETQKLFFIALIIICIGAYLVSNSATREESDQGSTPAQVKETATIQVLDNYDIYDNVILVDNFDTNANGWITGVSEESWKGSIQIKEGKYIWNIQESLGYVYEGDFLEEHQLQDFFISVRTHILGSQIENSCLVIFFRETEKGSYLLLVCGNQQFAVFESQSAKDGDKLIVVVEETYSDIIKASQENEIAILARGGQFVIFINGVYVNEFIDLTCPTGSIGLGVFTTDDFSGTIEFDELIITAP